MQMTVFRCDWCGRFYSSPLPEGSACDNHIPEHNARLRASIERHNARLRSSQAVSEPPHADSAEILSVNGEAESINARERHLNL